MSGKQIFPVELGKVIFHSGRNVWEGVTSNDWENSNIWVVIKIYLKDTF